jgi:hypothetical protein
MRRIVASCLFVTLLIGLAAGSLTGCAKGEYVGSSLSGSYHEPDCLWAENIDKERRVWFDSKEAAEAEGYVPCPTCLPDE